MCPPRFRRKVRHGKGVYFTAPADKLSPFAKHPYQVREDTAMDELVESIRVHGVLSPLLARTKGEGYELVSGHRRRLAAQKLDSPLCRCWCGR